MALLSVALRKLAAVNLTAEQMAVVIEIIAEQQEAEENRLAAQRERKAKSRARSRDSHRTVTGQDCDTPSPLVPPDKEAPTPQEITPPITPQPRFARPRETGNPIIVLQSAIDAASAQRWVQHCGEKRKPISVAQAEEQAAVLNEIRKLGASPAEAIRFAIGKGWTSLGVDYFRNNGFAFKAEQAAEIAEDWQNRMKVWDSDRTWSSSWGPKPGERGCRVPHPLNPKAA